MKKIILVLKIIIVVFALIGLFFTIVFIGMQFGLLNVRGSITERNKFFTGNILNNTLLARPFSTSNRPVYNWEQTPEWNVLSTAFTKDAPTINKVASETDVPARLIVSVVVPEQIRFFTSNRESYKKYFEPLKILGTLSQFSLGVSGIKPETAKQIEKNNIDPTSSFYPGDKYKNLLNYPQGALHDVELYNRLTDPHDHYYQYLYTALFIKQVMHQWQSSGFDLNNNPEIMATIFNIGFDHSVPSNQPIVGGAPIEIGGETLSYGGLSGEFYRSGELLDQFPN
ncbi:MAG: hypothetical protein KGL67_00685 [Patescibacteria group bacterium]|nr:hypothetical protein [Patescibacteria group bacterium]